MTECKSPQVATAPAGPNWSGEVATGLEAKRPAFWSPVSQWVLGQQSPAHALQLGGEERVWRGIGAPDGEPKAGSGAQGHNTQ